MKNSLVDSKIALPENIQLKLFYPEIKCDNNRSNNVLSQFCKLDDTFYLCYPSALHPHKNHQTLFKACELLPQTKKIKILLTITETELHNQLLDNNIDLNTRDRYLCVSELAREEMCLLYRNVDAIIFPSYKESLGLPLIEAVQFNLPVLASDAPYVNNLIHNAITFDPSDHNSVRKVLEEAFDLFQKNTLNSAALCQDTEIITSPSDFLKYTLG